MKRALTSCSLAALLPLPLLHAERDFNEAVRSIERTYSVHREHMPLIGLASLCAHVASGGAIKGIQIASFEVASFEDGTRLPVNRDLPRLLAGSLGSAWSLVVDTSNRKGEQEAIFARPHGDRMILMMISYEQGELSIVRADLDARHLRAWMNDPAVHAHHLETDHPETN